MRIRELEIVSGKKIGRIDKKNVVTEPHEDSTVVYLAQFGFDIELVKPANTYKTKSADAFMMGAIWEMKSPTTFNKATIKADFRKAKSQSNRIIFDLRRVKKNADDVEKQILKIFEGRGRVKKLIIIEKSGKVLDCSK
ncbi:MAG: hypothetical protein Q4F60_02655 [Candidatus Saccharibacteria bacterium]|nr:hypothetical protein [Candidatus Saccharibacteria bacterium]